MGTSRPRGDLVGQPLAEGQFLVTLVVVLETTEDDIDGPLLECAERLKALLEEVSSPVFPVPLHVALLIVTKVHRDTLKTKNASFEKEASDGNEADGTRTRNHRLDRPGL